MYDSATIRYASIQKTLQPTMHTTHEANKLNHVFMFQVHKDSELVERILHRLLAPNHFFAINIDKKSREYNSLLSVAGKIPNVVLITSYKISHGGFSFTNCTLSQMKQCLENKCQHFEYYHTCSGQDYPCVSNDAFDHFFAEGTISYIMLDSDEETARWRNTKYKNRLERINLTDYVNGRFADKLHLNGILRRVLYPIRRPYHDIAHLWGGWNWFSLSRECIKYILHYCSENPNFIERFKYTTVPDELVFPTILYPKTKDLRIKTRNSLRYIEWHPGKDRIGHPMLLDERDYEDILHSGALFCRKVERDYSKKLLDLLDIRARNMKKDELLLQNPKTP